jgi:hypothetical protein
MDLGDPSATIVDVTAFGDVRDSRTDATAAFTRALAACRERPASILLVPPGRYDFHADKAHVRPFALSNTTSAERRCAILIEGHAGLTVHAYGARFVCHGRLQPVSVVRSSGIVLAGFSVDWEHPLGAEARVVASDPAGAVDVEFDLEQYPHVVQDDGLLLSTTRERWWGAMVFGGDDLAVVPGTGDGWFRGRCPARAIAPNRVRLSLNTQPLPRPGDWLVLRTGLRDHAGLFLAESRDVRLRDIRLHHSAGLGCLVQFCEDVDIERFEAVPAPGRHVLSGHDDGINVSNCRGRVRISGCRFHGLMDDPINIHGTSVPVTERLDARRARCRFAHPQSVGLPWGGAGDRINLLRSASMTSIGEATIAAVTPDAQADTFTVTFETDLPAEVGAGNALENLTWSPEVEIRGCHFGSCRARGLLLSTPGRSIVVGNHFDSSGSAILIAGDAHYWYESGGARDCLIAGNTFSDYCLGSKYQYCEAIISICPDIPTPIPDEPVHRGIVILDNDIHTSGQPVLYALATHGLVFRGNRIHRSERIAPWHPRKAMATLAACRDVTLAGNTVDPRLDASVILDRTPEETVNRGRGPSVA